MRKGFLSLKTPVSKKSWLLNLIAIFIGVILCVFGYILGYDTAPQEVSVGYEEKPANELDFSDDLKFFTGVSYVKESEILNKVEQLDLPKLETGKQYGDFIVTNSELKYNTNFGKLFSVHYVYEFTGTSSLVLVRDKFDSFFATSSAEKLPNILEWEKINETIELKTRYDFNHPLLNIYNTDLIVNRTQLCDGEGVDCSSINNDLFYDERELVVSGLNLKVCIYGCNYGHVWWEADGEYDVFDISDESVASRPYILYTEWVQENGGDKTIVKKLDFTNSSSTESEKISNFPYYNLVASTSDYIILTMPCLMPKECGPRGLLKYVKNTSELSYMNVGGLFETFFNGVSVSPDNRRIVISQQEELRDGSIISTSVGYIDLDNDKYVELSELPQETRYRYLRCEMGCWSEIEWLSDTSFEIMVYSVTEACSSDDYGCYLQTGETQVFMLE